MKKILLLSFSFLITIIAFSQTTYTWKGGAGTSGSPLDYTVAGNWTPSRNSPATTDILVFDMTKVDGGSTVGNIFVTNVSSETVGQLQIIQSVTSTTLRTVTFSGTPGTLTVTGNLTIQQYCQLADGGYTISVGGDIAFQTNTGANATVNTVLHSGSGKIQVTGSSSRFYNGNGTAQTSGNFTFGNIEVFGSSANLSMTGTYNAIQINGTFTINAGKFTITNSTGNRTFVLNSTSSTTPTGTIQCTNGGLIVGGSNATLSVAGSGPTSGNQSIGTLNFDATSVATSTLNSLSLTRTNATLTIGSVLNNLLTVSGSITINSGTLNDGGNTITNPGGTMIATNNTTPGAAVYTGAGKILYTRANVTSPYFFGSGSGTSNTYISVGNITWAPNSSSTTNPVFNSSSTNNLAITFTGAFNFTRNGSGGSPTITLNSTVASLTVASTGNINVPTGLTFDFNSKSVTLQSDANGTASIGNISGSITNASNVTVQQYIQGGYRRYRFLSHPFSTAKALSLITSDIDITGTSGTGGGFTATTNNNPSAYYFNTANADGGSTNDAGWTAFTDATTANWAKGQGIRVFVRGTKGQSGTLDGTNASPNPVTLNMNGTINMGPVSINLVTGGTGSTAGFNLVGNPYPSPVDVGTVVNANSNVVKTIYLRNPTTSSYVTQTISGAYTIPANTAFFIKANAGTTLDFVESNKATNCSACAVVFGVGNSNTNYIQLKAFQGNDMYDNFYVYFNKENKDAYETTTDAVKLTNDGLNLYTLSSDDQKLAVDYRPFSLDGKIPVGISIPAAANKQTYTLQVSDYHIPNDVELYLHDKLTDTYTKLAENVTYILNIDTKDAATIGDSRLEITVKSTKILMADNTDNSSNDFKIQLLGNPVADVLKVNITAPNVQPVNVRIVDAAGRVLQEKSLGAMQKGTVLIPTNNMGKGLYLVQVLHGDKIAVEKFEKL